MNISVIITTYNQPDMLIRVLDALKYQTRLPDEVIVADDGSTSETKACIHRFISHSPYLLRHVWQEDKGFRAAGIRNKAIQKSESEYIIFLDGDCIPPRHFVTDHLALAEKGFFFQGSRILISEALSPEFTCKAANHPLILFRYLLSNHISNCHHLIRIPFFPNFTSTRLTGIRSCNMGIFREDLWAVNGFNEAFVGWGREDSELAVRLYRYGLKRKTHPFMAICFHLWHKPNDTTQLAVNDEILKSAIESDEYICSDGLAKAD